MPRLKRIALACALFTLVASSAFFVFAARDVSAGVVDCYPDADLDGFGEAGSSPTSFSVCPDGFSLLDTDCDDTEFATNPDAPELPNDGIDQDCDLGDLLPSDATGYFVSLTTGSDVNPGTMALPFATIQHAIDVINTTDGGPNVFVAGGTYVESIQTNVSIFGGYDPTDWTRDIDANLTEIEALAEADDDDSPAVEITGASAVAIQGFTLDALDFGSQTRGILANASVRATIVDNVIDGGGGNLDHVGIYIQYGHVYVARNNIDAGDGTGNGRGVWFASNTFVWIENNRISGGTGDDVFALTFQGHAGVIVNNLLDAGTATGSSAVGLTISTDNDEADTLVVNNVVLMGTANSFVTGMQFSSCLAPVVAVNNVIADPNVAAGGGTSSRGVLVAAAEVALVNNFIDAGHGDPAQGIYANTGSAITLKNNDIWSSAIDCLVQPDGGLCVNLLATMHLCLWAGCDSASGNISENPLFLGITNFHVQAASPLIDAGIDPVTWYDGDLADKDFEGDPRPQNGDWDIGVDERSTTTTTTTQPTSTTMGTTTTTGGSTTTTTIPGDDDADDDDATDDDATDDDADDDDTDDDMDDDAADDDGADDDASDDDDATDDDAFDDDTADDNAGGGDDDDDDDGCCGC
ncbi:hypothetical protein K8I61_00010 [bacterium]|nr:hypothetical protein [bacterium]